LDRKGWVEMEEKLLTAEDLAAYLNVCTKTVYRMLRRGQLPCYRVAGVWRFRKEAIDQWLEQRAPERKAVVGDE